MGAITRDDISAVCQVARLALTPEKMDAIAAQFQRLMPLIQQMQQLDTTGVAITTHGGSLLNVYREDVVGESLSPAEVVANAPDSIDTFFRTSLFMDE